MEYLEDTILELDDEYRIQYIKINNGSNRSVLYQVVRKKLYDVFEEEYAVYFNDMLLKSSADGESVNGEIEYNKNGIVTHYTVKIINIRKIILMRFRKTSG